jgi:ribose 5-phosphate isomerase B
VIVACGFDHAGYVLRERLLGVITAAGHEVLDFGTDRPEPVDYPDKALEVGRAVRAATIHDTYTARQGVEHDAVNVLCLGGRVVGSEVAAQLVATFLAAEVSGEERHARRRAKVQEIERTMGEADVSRDASAAS